MDNRTDLSNVGRDPTLLKSGPFEMFKDYFLKLGPLPLPHSIVWKRI